MGARALFAAVLAASGGWRPAAGDAASEECPAWVETHSPSLLQKATHLAPLEPSPPGFGDFRSGIVRARDAVGDAALLESMARRGMPLMQPKGPAVPIELPWSSKNSQNSALVTCQDKRKEGDARTDADDNLWQALQTFCKAGLGELAEFFVDPRFAGVRADFAGADGWLDQAFVSYFALRSADDRIGAEMDLLLQSVHHFSGRPIVAVNFGGMLPPDWTPERFPRLILVHARSAKDVTKKSFNFNKLTAMLFTKVRTGIALDADQWVNHGLDSLFERAQAETTQDYPYAIMPVHWMSRDPESSDMAGYPANYAFHFKSAEAPRRSMRWGHAHPTWTHFALPWLARWTAFVLAPDRTNPPQWLQDQGWLEDEDLLNIALWASNATKQWCKFDTPSPGDFKTYMAQKTEVSALFPDSKWFPNGIALIFFTAHDAKKPEESFQLLRQLWDSGDDRRRAVYFRGEWYGSGKALEKRDPGLRCMA